MADYGVKISQDGYDVSTATPSQLLYSSKWNNFKIYEILTCTVTLTGASTTGSNTVDNNLSYSPVYFPYVNPSTMTGKWRIALMGGSVTMPDDTDWAGVVVDYRPGTNDFLCYISHLGSGTRTFVFKITVFVDKFAGTAASLAPVGNYGFKTSKSGNSVLTADDLDLSTTTKFHNLTIAQSGNVDITNTGNVTHGLGYVPKFLVWFNPTGDPTHGSNWFPVPVSGSFNGASRHIEVWVDNDKIYFSTQDAVNPNEFKYILFNQAIN